MAFKDNSPSLVMYEDFKAQGIKHVDAARILFDTDRNYGGQTIGERLLKRSELSRRFVRAEPGDLDVSFFADFNESTQQLAAKLLKVHALPELEEHYLHAAPQDMQQSLESRGVDTAPYRNALRRIEEGEFNGPNDCFVLALLLFVASGCLGDTRQAAVIADEFAERHLNTDAHTVELHASTQAADDAEGDYFRGKPIGIVRIFDGFAMRSDYPFHELPQDRPTTIGSGNCDVTDVDEHVSRKHARIWMEDGRWYIEGMKSTNGVAVISGADKTVHVVEPPRSQRSRRYRPEPHQIMPADTICLGDTTRYIVSLASVE